MSVIHRFKILLVAIFAVVASGCVAFGVTDGDGSKADTTAPSWAAHINYRGDGLKVLSVRDWYNPSKGLKVNAEVQSLGLRSISFQYRVNWYDAQGAAISTTLSNWNQRVIRSGDTALLEAVSPGERALDYRIDIIEK